MPNRFSGPRGGRLSLRPARRRVVPTGPGSAGTSWCRLLVPHRRLAREHLTRGHAASGRSGRTDGAEQELLRHRAALLLLGVLLDGLADLLQLSREIGIGHGLV